MDQTLEQWRPVVGYEGLYEVSSLGRVKSLRRTSHRFPNGRHRIIPERILKPALLPASGYLRVALYRENRKKHYVIHKLVATAFLGPRPAGMLVAHGPAGQQCNELSNLSYKTPSGNAMDRLRDGTHNRGERHSSALLTTAQVVFLRKAVARGQATPTLLAQAWGLTPKHLQAIVRGAKWTWLNA